MRVWLSLLLVVLSSSRNPAPFRRPDLAYSPSWSYSSASSHSYSSSWLLLWLALLSTRVSCPYHQTPGCIGFLRADNLQTLSMTQTHRPITGIERSTASSASSSTSRHQSSSLESSYHRVIVSSSHQVIESTLSVSSSSSSNHLFTQSKIAAVQIVNLRFDHLTTRSRLLVKEND